LLDFFEIILTCYQTQTLPEYICTDIKLSIFQILKRFIMRKITLLLAVMLAAFSFGALKDSVMVIAFILDGMQTLTAYSGDLSSLQGAG
jgi:hypothetical protein